MGLMWCLTTLIKHTMLDGWTLEIPMVWARLSFQRLCYLFQFQCTSHPNIPRYGMSVVGFDHNSRWSGGSSSSIRSIHLSFTSIWCARLMIILIVFSTKMFWDDKIVTTLNCHELYLWLTILEHWGSLIVIYWFKLQQNIQ